MIVFALHLVPNLYDSIVLLAFLPSRTNIYDASCFLHDPHTFLRYPFTT